MPGFSRTGVLIFSLLLSTALFPYNLQAIESAQEPTTPNLLSATVSKSDDVTFKKSIPRAKQLLEQYKGLKGWGHLFLRLVEKGIDPDEAAAVFRDSKMPFYQAISFGLNPKEASSMYRKVNTSARRKHAVAFYKKHLNAFKLAEKNYNVPKEVVLAILLIESNCGDNTGNSPVFYRLARLASATDPISTEKSIKLANRISKKDQVIARGKWLEDTFLPHVMATFTVAKQLNKKPLELKGSPSGAVGLGQFLPGNILTYGIDGNTDGKVSPYDPSDAIPSIANFLNHYGWNSPTLTKAQKESVIRHYNNSNPYIATVLAVADSLAKDIKSKN